MLSKDKLLIQDMQAFHRELDQEKQFDQDIFRNIAYLSAEISDLVSAIRKFRKASNETESFEMKSYVGEELADCLAYVIKLANYAGIDLQDAYVNKMNQNLTREWHPKIK